MSEISKSLFTTISNAGFLIALIVFCILGNGSVLGILARFKKLRTYPNIPIANLALVDLLTALINMPLYLVFSILEVSWFKGKIMAIITLFMARLFMALNLTAMLVLLVNVLLALTCGLRYFTWKTNEKAVAIVFIDWFLCFLLVFLSCSTLFDIDLQNTHVLIYRQAYFGDICHDCACPLFDNFLHPGFYLFAKNEIAGKFNSLSFRNTSQFFPVDIRRFGRSSPPQKFKRNLVMN